MTYTEEQYKLGQMAFCAYSVARGTMDWNQTAFRELPEAVREAWVQAALAAVRHAQAHAALRGGNDDLGKQDTLTK